MGAWIDIGRLNQARMRQELIEHANKFLRSTQRDGELSTIVTMEPSPGYWGRTPDEYRQAYLQGLMGQLDDYENPDDSAGIILGGEEGRQKPSESWIFKEGQKEAQRIKYAMEHRTLRLLLGVLPNGCKVVAILLLKDE